MIELGEVTQAGCEVKADPDLLSSFYSDHFYTTIRKAHTEGSLALEQEEGGGSIERDFILLDRNAQHTLYLILKNRFEK